MLRLITPVSRLSRGIEITTKLNKIAIHNRNYSIFETHHHYHQEQKKTLISSQLNQTTKYQFHSLIIQNSNLLSTLNHSNSINSSSGSISITLTPPVRTVTKFSLNKGKRKTVKAVIKRFKRLHWGGWIRTRCGRHKKMHKKTSARKRRLRQHVLVNATQSWLLDKMVTKFWKRPKYYVDDPYEPYHTREDHPATYFKSKKY